MKRTLPDIKLIRADTTFDLSQKAEKNWSFTLAPFRIFIPRLNGVIER